MSITEKRRRPRDRRQQILLVARRLFGSSGYHAVTMGAIAEQVGITPGALYRHFANKSVLLEEVVASSVDDVAPAVAEAATLQQALSDTCAAAVRSRDFGVLWSREARYLPEAAYERLRDRLRAANRLYRNLIRTERPELAESDAELLAWGIQAILVSPGYHSLQLPTSEYAAVLHRLCAGLCATPLVRPRRNSPVHIQGLMPVSQRERLLAAATRLFGEHGYQATSMGDIGAAAGVTGPSLYSYFGSKSDLLRVVVDRGTHALWLGLHAALRNGRSARGALEAVVRSYVELCLENNTLMSALIAEPALMADTTRASEREYVAEWVALVRAGHPPIRERHAAIRVHAALVLINNLARTSRTRTGAPPCEDLVAMAMAVLLAEDTSARMRSAV